MGNESDRYRGEAGEPLAVDLDGDVRSKLNEPKKHVLDVASERSPTLVAYKRRNRKPSIESGPVDVELGGNGVSRLVRNANSGGQKKENRKILGKKRNAAKRDNEKMRDRDVDSEIKEMWDTIVADNPEVGQEAIRTVDGDKFIDDNGGDPSDHLESENKHSPSHAPQVGQEAVRIVDGDKFIDDKGGDPSDHLGGDNKHSPSQAPQAEEEEEEEVDEINKHFMIGKRKKKEINETEIALLVEKTVAELHVAADVDAELNRHGKPAITKLRNLSLLTDIIPRQHLQQQFLDRGVLDALKAWLEPLPDKSMPSINVRAAVFKCLSDLTIDLEQPVRKEHMKKSGIAKAVIFFCKYDKETAANRKAAQELVDKWSRAIFHISTRYEDNEIREEKGSYKRAKYNKSTRYKDIEILDENGSYMRTPVKKGQTSGPSSSMQRASIPEVMSMDFAVRPRSKVDPDAVRAQAKQTGQGYHRANLNRKMQRRKAPKKQQAVGKPNPSV